MSKFTVGFNGQEGGFEVHAVGCRDLSQPRKIRDFNGRPWNREAVDGAAALEAELRQDFSGGCRSCENGAACTEETHAEHPAANGYASGSYGAAGFGFSSRVFPCCKRS